MNYATIFKSELLESVLPFWEQNSLDFEHGGYFSCMARNGEVYDTDKFVWLQGRQAWLFSMIYKEVSQEQRWLDTARSGIDFLSKHGRDDKGDFYFSLTREGRPLVKPYNIFSDCFAAMAFAQYARASGSEEYGEQAKSIYRNILKRKDNPKGPYEKGTGLRALKSFALPMILSNLVLELEDFLPKTVVQSTVEYSLQEVMEVFRQKESGLIHEYVLADGSLDDSFDGRLINPGHGLEAMWFMIDIGVKFGDSELINKAIDTILVLLEYGWDSTYGGVLYFMDAQGHPPQQLEHDQKLWWVHLEALVALAKAYEHRPTSEVYKWYKKVHDYTFERFPDPEYGEWYGYLNREGRPHLNLKGGKWKGCFHVPRGLYQCWKTFERIEAKEKGIVS